MFFPLIIFLGSGICDSTVQFLEQRFFSEGDIEPLTIALFGTAFIIRRKCFASSSDAWKTLIRLKIAACRYRLRTSQLRLDLLFYDGIITRQI